jgi:hypothetical protein
MAEYRSSRSLRTELAGKLKRLGLLTVFTEARVFESMFRNFGETGFESLRVEYRTDGEVYDHLTLFVDAIKAPSLKAQESEK